ncbi:hypothetical protein [Neisseria bacilliformis]|uniref:hypothetical protein n=1 Tax=Neisseria bacilliformis TaxID=267212 RepID=UPI0028EC06A5|nr:hypothetical protein [Neisseria bacilliformis]
MPMFDGAGFVYVKIFMKFYNGDARRCRSGAGFPLFENTKYKKMILMKAAHTCGKTLFHDVFQTVVAV